MFLNYFRIALRQMRRNKLYSVINILCLAAGITVTLTILLYEVHERSFDRWHRDSERIFAMTSGQNWGSGVFFNNGLSVASGPEAMQADAAVGSMTRMFNGFLGVELQNTARPGEFFRETHDFYFADSNFFRFFSFRLLRGQAASVLARPFTVVLTESEARKYFGSEDPVGKILQMDGRYPLEVTGLAEDIPSNSSIRFGMIASLATMRGMEKYDPYLHGQRLGAYGAFTTWLLLNHPGDTTRVQQSLRRAALQLEGKTKSDENFGGIRETHQFRLYPMAGEHSRTAAGTTGHYAGPLMLVAAVILLLALVNYMSLATAQGAVRAKEVGVRKVLGAARGSLASQFYVESVLYVLIAFMAGGLLFFWSRGYIYSLLQLKIDRGFAGSPMVLAVFAGLFLGIAVLAGSYPALVLSQFRPVAVLYGKLSRQMGADRVRKVFIVLQFSISMILVISSFVIGKQVYFVRHTDTGIDRENVVMLPFAQTMQHYEAYRGEISALPGVKGVACSFFKLYDGGSMMSMLNVPGKSAPIEAVGLIADSNFISLLGLKWKEAPAAGSVWTGRGHVFLNEEAAALYELGEGPVGTQVRVDDRLVTVAGVLKNFNFFSLRGAIKPFVVNIDDDPTSKFNEGSAGCLYVKIGAHQNVPAVMERIRKIYSGYDAKTAFSFEFLDDAYDSMYRDEDRLAGLMGVFTMVTVVIACLGLFALATFAAGQRVKEIGIRKVLGASVASIGALLSRELLRPVVLAVLIACPVAWWLMRKWLQNFAFRTELSWWVFAVSGGALLMVALATVLFRTLRAARANPVDNLRIS